MRQDLYSKENEGYVYILANKYMPYVVKIGKAKDVEDRVKRINKHEGVPGEYRCVYKQEVFNKHITENEIHKNFKTILINDGYGETTKEFFIVPSIGYAICNVQKIIALCKKKYKAIKIDKQITMFGDDNNENDEKFWHKTSAVPLWTIEWDKAFKPKKKSPIGSASEYRKDEMFIWYEKPKKKKKRKKNKNA